MATENDIQGFFNQYLGRSAGNPEMDFYKKFVDEGFMQPYEVGQALQATPEYQSNMLARQGAQLGQMLGANDEYMMGKSGDQLARRFYQQGRNVTGSGYTNAYMNAARDLAAQRQNQLADFYGGGLSGLRQTSLDQGNYALQNRGYGQRDSNRDWARQLQMYEMQKNDYNDMMNTQNRRNLQGSLIQGAVGLGSMAALGGMGGLANMGGVGGFGGGFMGMFGGGTRRA